MGNLRQLVPQYPVVHSVRRVFAAVEVKDGFSQWLALPLVEQTLVGGSSVPIFFRGTDLSLD